MAHRFEILRRRAFSESLLGSIGTSVLIALLACIVPRAGASVRVTLPEAAPPTVRFAGAEIERAALHSPFTARVKLEIADTGAPQSYRIERAGDDLTVIGADAVGAMYGGLDVAEAIHLGSLDLVKLGEHKPFIAERGIKFNIPLDARTPSYTDGGDAGQQNIPVMWSMEFWHSFLDAMARDRYNVLSLWNLHPFPSLVRVPEYPQVALNDVMRTTNKFDSTYDLSAADMVRPETLAHLTVVKKMTIDAKIQFWRQVMQYAKDRGIDVYLFTWNIFDWGADGKYGITSSQSNPVTIDYFRKSVKATFLTYPLLAGMGITAGEHMQHLKGELSDENWLWKTYGEGIADVQKIEPKRSIRLIHRTWETNFPETLEAWRDFHGTFDFSFKYSWAHMYSEANPPFAIRGLRDMPGNLRTWMEVRNDDIYSFRWGGPDFARSYIESMPGPDKMVGFIMGPDGYIWGREFISTEPDTPRQLVIDKQWYSFMLWGRLSYDPTLSDEFFRRTLERRFPSVPGKEMFEASTAASKIIPQVTRFFWRTTDLAWFPEACVRHPHAGSNSVHFYTVQEFAEGHTMPGSGIVDIGDWSSRLLQKQPIDGETPPQVAEALQNYAKTTLQLVAELRPKAETNKELRLTLGDDEAMADLGNYYAEKILGASDLALYEKGGDASRKAAAIGHLQAALAQWEKYAVVATRQYKPQLLDRIGYVNLNDLTALVRQDIDTAMRAKHRVKK